MRLPLRRNQVCVGLPAAASLVPVGERDEVAPMAACKAAHAAMKRSDPLAMAA